MSATSAETCIGNRIQKIYFALVGSKHEIGRVGIIWIALRCATSSGNGAIDYCEIAFVFNLERRSHILFVGFDGGIEFGDSLQIGTFTGNKFYRSRLWRGSLL